MTEFRKFKDINIELLKDPADAKAYLEAALEEYDKDRDKKALLLALKDITEALYSSYKNQCCLDTWKMKDKLDRELYRKRTDADPFLELFDRLESLDSDTGNRPMNKCSYLLSDRELAYLEAWDNNFRDALELERKRKEADESINQQ